MFRVKTGKTILLSINLSDEGNVGYAIAKGEKIIETGSCALNELESLKRKKKVTYARVALLSELSFFDIAQLTVRNDKFINMAVKKYINEQSVFMEPFKVSYKQVKKNDAVRRIAVSAIPEADLNRIAFLKDLFIVEYVVPLEIVVSKFAISQNNNTSRVLWAYLNTQIDLEIEKGCLKSKTVSAYNKTDEIDTSFYPEDTVFLGEFAKQYKDDELSEDEKFKNKLAHFYGLFKLDKDFDFLEKEYIHKVVSYELSRVVFAFSIFAFFGLGFFGVNNFFQYASLVNKFEKKHRALIQNVNYTNSHMPKLSELKRFIAIEKLQKESNKQMDLGGFLTWITHIAPKEALIDNVDIESYKAKNNNNQQNYQEPPSASSNFSQNIEAPKLSSKNFAVSITLVINGTYIDTKATARQFLKELTKKIETDSSEFMYDENLNRATLVTKFKIDGSKF